MAESNDKDRVNFEEVAKVARSPGASPPGAEERSDNSGLINLTAMVAGAAATKVVHGPVPSRPSPIAAPAEKERGNTKVWIALAAGIALGALAAAVIFAMPRTNASGPVALVPLGAVPHETAQRIPPTSPVSSTNTNRPNIEPPSGDRAVDPSSVALAIEKPVAPSVPMEHALSTASGAASALPQPIQPKTRAAGAAASSPAEAPAASSGDQSLEALMKQAIGGRAAAPPPAAMEDPQAPSRQNLPLKPALGAVQGALGTVLPSARSCLGPDDPVSRATITFKSDGSVQAVDLSGHAAGEPAEECIRSRLMAARVPPFASPTFTWTVTVRPAG